MAMPYDSLYQFTKNLTSRKKSLLYHRRDFFFVNLINIFNITIILSLLAIFGNYGDSTLTASSGHRLLRPPPPPDEKPPPPPEPEEYELAATSLA